MTDSDEALRLLVVSSSNTCRSPMAAALLNQAIGRAQVPAVVDSAGLESGGRQPHAHAALALQQYGLTIEHVRSQQLSRSLLAVHDVVLTMTRAEACAVIEVLHDAKPRTFTIGWLANARLSPRSLGPDDVQDWTDRLDRQRPASALLGHGRDEVAPPDRRSSVTYADTAGRLARCAGSIAELLGQACSQSAASVGSDRRISEDLSPSEMIRAKRRGGLDWVEPDPSGRRPFTVEVRSPGSRRPTDG